MGVDTSLASSVPAGIQQGALGVDLPNASPYKPHTFGPVARRKLLCASMNLKSLLLHRDSLKKGRTPRYRNK